jgi:3-deoxy-D-manno-octulosonic-acid transferase
MILLYNMALIAGALISSPYWVLRILFTPKYRKNFIQRFGHYPQEIINQLENKKPLWIHAVSVGETLTAIILVKEIKKKYPDLPIMISNVTVTGHQISQQNKALFAGIIYFPLDFPWIVAKSLCKFNPRALVIMETELWPNFLSAAKKKNIPIILANGRISDRSVKRYLKIKPLVRAVAQCFTALLMQSAEDAKRMEKIGGEAGKIEVTGNLKFDLNPPHPSPEEIQALKVQFGLEGNNKEVWVAGSTHPGEEEHILKAVKALRTHFPQFTLILAPRHPERAEEVEKLIEQYGFTSIRRSLMKKDASYQRDVYLIDTVGELSKLYLLGQVAFVGGSLITKGGHNVLEPAILEKPVLFGPYMSNFRDSAELLLAAKGGLQVQSGEELPQALETLYLNPESALQTGKNGAAAVRANSGATQKTLSTIEKYF